VELPPGLERERQVLLREADIEPKASSGRSRTSGARAFSIGEPIRALRHHVDGELWVDPRALGHEQALSERANSDSHSDSHWVVPKPLRIGAGFQLGWGDGATVVAACHDSRAAS
jgi:hypothetical protein